MSKTRPLIAIVDDEQSVRKALERLLRSAGIDAEAFRSGEDFLKSLARRRASWIVRTVDVLQFVLERQTQTSPLSDTGTVWGCDSGAIAVWVTAGITISNLTRFNKNYGRISFKVTF